MNKLFLREQQYCRLTRREEVKKTFIKKTLFVFLKRIETMTEKKITF